MTATAATAAKVENVVTGILTVQRLRDGWRWNLTDPRATETIGASTQGYSRRLDCFSNIVRVLGFVISPPRSRAKVFAFRLDDIGIRACNVTLVNPAAAPRRKRKVVTRKAKRRR